MVDKQSVYVMPENVSRTFGKDAQRNNILAAKIVADIVKTTLGPKGMDKMLVDSGGNVIVTNDGVTILNEMEIDHPAAKMMVEMAKTQENEVGDGTTSVVLLAGKLLENAEKLLDRKIHPTVIVKGYKFAADKALEILNEISVPLKDQNVLKQIAMTAMTGKGAEGNKERLSDLIINAVNIISSEKNFSSEDVKVQKIKGNLTEENELIEGVILDKERANADMPLKVEKGKILLIDFSLELRSPETETRIAVSTPEQLESFIASEERYLKSLTDKIINSGAKAVFCQKGIDDVAQYYLAKAGIFACRRVSKSDMEKISKATSGKIISNLNDINEKDFGYADIIEEVRTGDQQYTYIKGCRNPKVVTIIVSGSTDHAIDEIERAIKDGLGDVISAFRSGRIVAGGGSIEIELARKLRIYARTLGGREQLAIEEFANSLESIPEALAENAGLDPIEVIAELKRRHEGGSVNDGLNLFNNKIEDTIISGIVEPMKVKTQAIQSASEVAMMILRIDDVLISKGNASANVQSQNQYEGMD